MGKEVMRITADMRHAGFCFIGFVVAIIASPAESAAIVAQQQGLEAHRRTPSDFPPGDTAGFDHGRTNVTVAESAYAAQLRQHIASIPVVKQKRDAYVSMRLLRKLHEAKQDQDSGPFNILADLRRAPGSYIGRPIVLYGRIKRVRSTPAGTAVQLLDLNSRTGAVLANIDIVNANTTTPNLPEGGYPARLVAYLVKLTDGDLPLMLSPQVEWLHQDSVILDGIVKHKTRGVRQVETGAYYETLMKARLITYSAQQKWAETALLNRISERLQLAEDRHERERAKADSLQATAPARASELTRMADARLTNERELHKKYKSDPANYPLFADVFMNPDSFLGKPITLTGHVRKVMTYDSDFERFGTFGGGKLHELWLYTSDSQQNPAVIICEKLPPDMPADGSTVAGVTVTGYFFKLYRYAAGDADRAAPMVLAKHVTWAAPTEQHIAGLGSTKSIATVLAIIVGGCFMMYLWSNYQGDRRARQALTMARAVDAGPGTKPMMPDPSVLEATQPVPRQTSSLRQAEPRLQSAPGVEPQAPLAPRQESTASAFEQIVSSPPGPVQTPRASTPLAPTPPAPAERPDPLARAKRELENTMQKLDDKATSRRERLANAAASIAGASNAPVPREEPVDGQTPQAAAQVQPASIIGANIVRVLQQSDGRSFLELTSGVALSLANDVVSLTPRAPASAQSSPGFESLAGSRISHLALDQWDRVYLLADGTVFVTEDFEDDGRRCLIFGELTTLVAEEPDLTLSDYWTRAPLA